MGYTSQKKEKPSEHNLSIEADYAKYIPDEFKRDPFGYFDEYGVNIKPGEKVIDETGRVREDPTAVKELPV